MKVNFLPYFFVLFIAICGCHTTTKNTNSESDLHTFTVPQESNTFIIDEDGLSVLDGDTVIPNETIITTHNMLYVKAATKGVYFNGTDYDTFNRTSSDYTCKQVCTTKDFFCTGLVILGHCQKVTFYIDDSTCSGGKIGTYYMAKEEKDCKKLAGGTGASNGGSIDTSDGNTGDAGDSGKGSGGSGGSNGPNAPKCCDALGLSDPLQGCCDADGKTYGNCGPNGKTIEISGKNTCENTEDGHVNIIGH